MLSVVMLSVVMLSVLAPKKHVDEKNKKEKEKEKCIIALKISIMPSVLLIVFAVIINFVAW